LIDDDILAAILVPVSADGEIIFTIMDLADEQRLGNRSLSLGSHGYPQLFWEGELVLLHRWILGLKKRDGLLGDHVNRIPLDNRGKNLRAVSPSGSSQNVSGRGKSAYRGVHPVPSGRWQARVKFQGEVYYLGTFDDEESAAIAADSKRRQLMPQYIPNPM
jgi:hypothetical protein